jgi:alkylmercury lyase
LQEIEMEVEVEKINTTHDLAERAQDGFPRLSEQGRRVALATHRLLARGLPVPDYGIAAAAGLDIQQVRKEMDQWPGVYRNDSDRVVGFWGLALEGMSHSFEVEGVGLCTWCAWDTLFLPELLQKTARVTSPCGLTGTPLSLVVTPTDVTTSHDDLTVSFVDPGECEVDSDRLISTFCNRIHFFESPDAAWEWKEAGQEDVTLLSLQEAFEVGRACNLLRFGDSLRR